ncbi:right-handed parallel beta-helix repeat-containing protein [Methanogenium sp. S4BF]|uniref:NosD domain-containing protein n=1 Tax=Methanogenium sp. S4BF TaxID=1789226 RepID=UPI002415D2AD|nr:NosD domain-containing protein [Methanogenium sp. S4BF]WFN34533.1 right-handed parallel beta-helix repeat-containing protein [Methanogenium sp. S4BF]
MKRLNSEPGGCLRWIAVMLLLFIFIGIAPASAEELPDCLHVYVNVSNDLGPRFSDSDNGSYYMKFDGGGLNALHLTTDTAVPTGQVTTSNDQSGVFYITDTGGRGYSDNTILMFAVNGTVPDDFALTVRASGYVWEPVAVVNTLPLLDNIEHIDGTMEETFTKEDLIYGPQTWKPAGNNLPKAYPIYFEQDTSDTGNPFQLMFIDLKAGPISKATGLASSSDLTDCGGVKVEYTLENLETFAAFNAYVWCNQSNQGQGISWTNKVADSGASVYQVIGIPPELTSISVSPETAEITEGEGQQFTAIALDQNDRTMSGIEFEWTSSDETVGTVSETGYFTALTAGTTTITAINESIEGEALVTVIAKPSGPQLLPDYNNIFVKVANDGGVKYNAFENNTYNIRFEGYDRGLNALHISTDPTVNFGQVTVSENQTGTFYATDSGGKGYEDEILLMLAVNGTIPDDFSLRVQADGYTWTPNPVSNQAPPLDNVTYQPVALDETFTKEDFRYGPQIWKPTGNGFDYPIYADQNMSHTENTFQVMFIDLNAGVLRPNAALENNGAVRITYTFENLETFAAFNVYAYCQNSNNGDDMIAWSNALGLGKAGSGYSVIGAVSGPVPDRIEVEPTTVQVAVGDVYHFAATAYDALNTVIRGLTFLWASSNEGVGTIDESGNFTAIAQGTTNVTASRLSIVGTSVVTVVSAEPSTWYVDGSGSGDFTDLDTAFANPFLKDGDTILVSAGSYALSTPLAKTVTLTGEGADVVTVTPTGAAFSGAGTAIEGIGFTSGTFSVSGAESTVAHCSFSGFSSSQSIYISGQNVTLDGNVFENNPTRFMWVTGNGHTITNNTFEANGGTQNAATRFDGCSGLTIALNTFANNTAPALGLRCTVDDNRIFLNDFIDNKADLFQFTNTPKPLAMAWEISSIDYTYLGTQYTGPLGNYHSSYTGDDADGNGVIDTAYTIGANQVDNAPLVGSWETYFPETLAPTADFTANVTTGIVPLSVAFGDTSIDSPASWAWDFENDGVVDSTEQNATYTYTVAGTYSVNLTVTNTAGSDSEVKIDFITVTAPQPKTVTVGASGCDFTDLDSAFASPSLNDGDTILVSAGSYALSTPLAKTVTLTGEGADVVTVTPTGAAFSGAGTAIEGIGFTSGTFSVSGAESTVAHCSFSGFSSSQSIYISGQNVTLDGNVFENNPTRFMWVTGNGHTITNNTFEANGGTQNAATRFDGCSGLTIARNTFANNTAPALGLRCTVDDNRIFLNDFIDNKADLFQFTNNPKPLAMAWEISSIDYTHLGTSYTGPLGNYHSSYTGDDADGNGVIDAAYTIGTNQVDNAPLVNRWQTYFPDAPASKTVTVGASGCDFTDLDSAFASPLLNDGDTILVSAGSYALSTPLAKTVTLSGEGADVVAVTPIGAIFSGAGTVIEGIGFTSGTFSVSGAESTVAHCSFSGFSSSQSIYISGQNVTLDGNVFENNPTRFMWVTGNGHTITNNTFEANGGTQNAATRFDGCSGLTIARNTFANNTAPALGLRCTVDDNQVFLNNFIDNKADLFQFTNNPKPLAMAWEILSIDYTYLGTQYTGPLGNYHSSYTGDDADGNGVIDTVYTIGANQVDNAPLVGRWQTYFPGSEPEPVEPVAPTANFTADVTEGTAPLSVQFTDVSTNSPTSWAWDFENDGVVDSTEQNPTHLYTTAGTYSVNLTVVNEAGSDSEIRVDLIVVNPGASQTWYVDASGEANFTTIQAAIDTAADGDTIIVRDGTYNESVNVTKSVFIRSENGPENTVVHCVTSGGYAAVFTVQADGTTISGFTLTGTNSGIFCDGYSDCIFSDNICSGVSGLDFGIWVRDGSGILIENNTLYGHCKYGVYFDRSSNCFIRNNIISGNQMGIYLFASSPSQTSGNIVSGNLFTGNVYGLDLPSASGSQITNNTIRENDYAIRNMRMNNEIYANTIVNNTELFSVNPQWDNLWNSPEPVTYLYNGATCTGLIGNYWGGAFLVEDADGNGIADSAVTLYTGVFDNAPLMMPVPAYYGGSCDGIPVPTSIEFSEPSYVIPEEGVIKFTVTVCDQNGKEMAGIGYEWSSNNDTVGTFEQGYELDGTFTGLAPGEATVLVKSYDIEATAEVTVNQTSAKTVWVDPCESTDGWTFSNAGLIDSVFYTGSHSIGVAPCPANSSAERTIEFPEGCTELSFRLYIDRLDSGAGIMSTTTISIDGEEKEQLRTSYTRKQFYKYSYNISGYEPGLHTLKVENYFKGKATNGGGFYIDLIKLRSDIPETFTITLSPAMANLNPGETQQFTAIAFNMIGDELPDTTFTWTVSDTSVGTIDTTGYFTASKVGTTTISAAAGDAVGTATVMVAPPHGDQTSDSPLNVPGCNISDKGDGTREVIVNLTATNATVNGNAIRIDEDTFTLIIETEGAPTVGNGTANGTVAGISLNTTPVSTNFDSLGNVTASLMANLTGIPSGAGLETTISANISAAAQSAFQIAATADGLNLDAVAYTMNVVKTNLTNGQDISDATIRMSVSPAWVAANGGYGAVRIIRFAEDGTMEVLNTVYLGFDGELDQFEAFSPNGLSIFGLSAASVPSVAPSGSGFSSSGGVSSSISTARCDGINAGETGVFVMERTAITEIDVKAGMNIPSMMLTAEKVAKPSNIGDAPNAVYQYVEVTSYLAPEDSMEMATLKFGVDKNWLDSLGAAVSDVKMYHYDEATDSWVLLSTVACGEDGTCYTFFADTPSFSLFAISAESDESAPAAEVPADVAEPTAVVSGDTSEQAQPTTPAKTGSTTMMVITAFCAILSVCGVVSRKKTNGKK